MKAKRLNIGIDVSKSKLDICILDENKRDLEYMTILNTENSIIDFLNYLNLEYPKAKLYFGYEATNNYMRVLQRILNKNKYKNLMDKSKCITSLFQIHRIKRKNRQSR